MEDYRVVEIKDSYNDNNIITTIMLNNKHSIRDFQNEIDRIKNEKYEEIMENGNDWEIVGENISENFDWFELDYDYDYLQI